MATKFVAPVTALELLVIVSFVGKPCGENLFFSGKTCISLQFVEGELQPRAQLFKG